MKNMRLLLDECTPRRLRRGFPGHMVSTIEEAGLKGLKNGALLRAASLHFDVLVTVDKNIEYQQNLDTLPMTILILSVLNSRFQSIAPLLPKALESLGSLSGHKIIKIENS